MEFFAAELIGGKPWWPLLLCALLLGMNKAGLRGLNIIVIPVFVAWFGGRASTAIVLPLLLTGDVLAIVYYRNSVDFHALLKLLPATLAGITVGMLLGRAIPDNVFRYSMGAVLLVCLGLMAAKEFSSGEFKLPDRWIAHSSAGFLGGLTTMIGNAAGPIMAIYLMSMNLGKAVFIGTGAVFFFVVNAIKVPIHVVVWKTMTFDSLGISLRLAPVVALGFFAGLWVVNLIPEKPFRWLVLAATLASTVTMFL